MLVTAGKHTKNFWLWIRFLTVTLLTVLITSEIVTDGNIKHQMSCFVAFFYLLSWFFLMPIAWKLTKIMVVLWIVALLVSPFTGHRIGDDDDYYDKEPRHMEFRGRK